MSQEAGAPRPPRLVDSLSRLGRTALGVLRTRLEILGTELEEERIHFAQLALAVAAIAFCLQMAVLLFVVFLVVLRGRSHRLATLGSAAAAFLIAGVVGMLVLKRRLQRVARDVRELARRARQGRRAAEVNRRRIAQIHSRRERLLRASAAERDELAAVLAPLRSPLAVADRGIVIAAVHARISGLVAIVAAVFVVLSPKRAFRWARRAFAAWRGARWAARTLRELAP